MSYTLISSNSYRFSKPLNKKNKPLTHQYITRVEGLYQSEGTIWQGIFSLADSLLDALRAVYPMLFAKLL